MRRLSLHIYVTCLGILVPFIGLVSIASPLSPMGTHDRRVLTGAVLGAWLPGPDRPVDELQAAVARLGRLLPVDLAGHGADGTLLAAGGDPWPPSPPGRTPGGWMRLRGGGPLLALTLPDGRRVVVRRRHPHPPVGVLPAVAPVSRWTSAAASHRA
jgi:hypothetical protein